MDHQNLMIVLGAASAGFLLTLPSGRLQRLLIAYSDSLYRRIGRKVPIALSLATLVIAPIAANKTGTSDLGSAAWLLAIVIMACASIAAAIDFAIFLLRSRQGL